MRNIRPQALTALTEALDMALPDRLLMPFAEAHAFIAPLLDALAARYPRETLSEIAGLGERFEAGRQAALRRLNAASTPFGLTEQEGRTAQLAAGGLSNIEIAVELSISVNTVKAHLKVAFRKCGVGSRAGLRQVLRASPPPTGRR